MMKIVLGTMIFGPQLDTEASRTMVRAFLETGNRELDTAYVYNGGDTENILGAILLVGSATLLVARRRID